MNTKPYANLSQFAAAKSPSTPTSNAWTQGQYTKTAHATPTQFGSPIISTTPHVATPFPDKNSMSTKNGASTGGGKKVRFEDFYTQDGQVKGTNKDPRCPTPFNRTKPNRHADHVSNYSKPASSNQVSGKSVRPRRMANTSVQSKTADSQRPRETLKDDGGVMDMDWSPCH